MALRAVVPLSFPRTFLGLAVLALPTLAQRGVTPGLTIQDAIYAASPGDTLYVGDYPATPSPIVGLFIDRPITLVGGVYSATVDLPTLGGGLGGIEIQTGGRVTLDGAFFLPGHGYEASLGALPGITARPEYSGGLQELEELRLINCYVLGGDTNVGEGAPAVSSQARLTTVIDSTLIAANSYMDYEEHCNQAGWPGAAALDASLGTVVVARRSEFQGGDATRNYWSDFCTYTPPCGGGNGGAGVRARKLLHDGHCTFVGGAPSDWFNLPSCGAPGLPYQVEFVSLLSGTDADVPPPTASFQASPVSGVRPLAVHFTASAVGEVTSWSWNFGDGTGSTQQNPTHVYRRSGTFTVQLHAHGPGGTDTVRRFRLVHVEPGYGFKQRR